MAEASEKIRLWAEWAKTDDGEAFDSARGSDRDVQLLRNGRIWVLERLLEEAEADRDRIAAEVERLKAELRPPLDPGITVSGGSNYLYSNGVRVFRDGNWAQLRAVIADAERRHINR